MRLFEMIDLGDMLGGVGELKAGALAMPTRPIATLARRRATA
jgi:hypothetical protein